MGKRIQYTQAGYQANFDEEIDDVEVPQSERNGRTFSSERTRRKKLSTITRQAADHETESLDADPESRKARLRNDDQEWGTTPVSHLPRSICFGKLSCAKFSEQSRCKLEGWIQESFESEGGGGG